MHGGIHRTKRKKGNEFARRKRYRGPEPKKKKESFSVSWHSSQPGDGIGRSKENERQVDWVDKRTENRADSVRSKNIFTLPGEQASAHLSEERTEQASLPPVNTGEETMNREKKVKTHRVNV